MISYDCQMQGLTCGARRIREPARQVNSQLRPVPQPATWRSFTLACRVRRSLLRSPNPEMSFQSSLVSGWIWIQHHFMNIKRLSVAFAVISFLPLLAHAQAGETNGGSSPLANLFWTVGPFVIIGVLFFIRAVRKGRKQSDDYMASQKQHNERVEQILERIAKALEQKG